MIYLDNAATSLRRPEGVVRAVSEALCSMGNVGRGASESALSAARVVYAAREKLCAFFGGADPSRVCFTQNSTEALNTAIFGLLRPGDHVISTDLEHNSVLRPLYRLEQEGVPARRCARLHRLCRSPPRAAAEHPCDRLHARLQSHRQRAGRIPHRRFCARARSFVHPRRLADGGQL